MRTIGDVDLRAVEAFVAVVEHGSFRAAARALGMPRSTLSERVASLETALDAQLLARTTRSVGLTDIGARYHHDVAPALEALRTAESRVADASVEPSGRLRMTAAVELGQSLFGPVLVEYARRHPQVEVAVELTDRIVSLVDEGFDLAVRVGPLDDSRLIARKLGEGQRLGLYASPAYLAGAPPIASPSDLADHQCLVMTGARDPRTWEFRKGRRTVRATVTPHFAVNSFLVLARLCVAGLGVARLPARYARELPLEELLPELAPPERATYAVHPHARHVSPALRAMIDLLVSHYEEGGPPALPGFEEMKTPAPEEAGVS